MAHVPGKNEKTLHQRCGKYRNHRERKVDDQVAETPANRRQAEKGDDRRDGRGKHQGSHADCRIFSRGRRSFAQVPVTEIRVFANDDGVIDHETEADDQCEQRDHVDRQAGGKHHRHGREHGDRNPGRDPECGAGVQEKKQQADDQDQAEQPVVQQNTEPLRNRFSPGSNQFDRDTVRQGQLQFTCSVLDLFLHANGVTKVGTVDANRHRRVLSDEITAPLPGPGIIDLGDVPNHQHRPVRQQPEYDVPDLVRGPFLDPRPNPGRASGHVTGRVRRRFLGNRCRDFPERDVVPDQRYLRNIDDDFRFIDTPDCRSRYSPPKQFCHEFIGETL